MKLEKNTHTRRSRPKVGGSSRNTAAASPLWTVQEVAAYLRLKEETVRIMARADRIPALKVGRVWRFLASEIEEMLGARKNHSV